MRSADLHVHTAFSDGTSTPEQVVAIAQEVGLDGLAITDHDTTQAVQRAMQEGRERGIEVIPGIELTAEYQGVEIHILGYLLDFQDARFQERLAGVQRDRVDRIRMICDRLKAIGIGLEPEKVFAFAGAGTVGRLHVARALVSEGFAGSVPEAFQRFIGDKSAAYVAHFRFSPQQAIALIRSVRGVAVLAHPYSLRDEGLIPVMVEAGLQGIEVFYPEHSAAMTAEYRALARQYGLVMTGGSDFHGSAKPTVSLGQVTVPWQNIEELIRVRP